MKTICDWKNCKEIGSYKAPIERDNSKKFRLLCLEHIKIFNKNWNYFENMNDQEIEFFIKSDLTWHKSTKNFGLGIVEIPRRFNSVPGTGPPSATSKNVL